MSNNNFNFDHVINHMIANNVFGDFFGQSNTYYMTITKKEAEEGCVKPNSFQYTVKCDDCNGTGDKDKSDAHICKDCDGKGEIRKSNKFLFWEVMKCKRCNFCNGIGRIVQNACCSCNGTGRVSTPIEIHIPAGTKDKERILLKLPDKICKDYEIIVTVK